MGLWGPDSPRWMLWLGLGVGIWYLAILVMTLKHPAGMDKSSASGIVVGVIDALTISGCIYRLRKRNITQMD